MAQYLGYHGDGLVRSEQVGCQAVAECMRAVLAPGRVYSRSTHPVAEARPQPVRTQFPIRGMGLYENIRKVYLRTAIADILNDGTSHLFGERQRHPLPRFLLNEGNAVVLPVKVAEAKSDDVRDTQAVSCGQQYHCLADGYGRWRQSPPRLPPSCRRRAVSWHVHVSA